MRLRAWVAVAALAVVGGLGLSPRVAHAASDFFLKLERVEVEPYFGPLAKVKVYVSPMTMEGGLISSGLQPSDLLLQIGQSRRRDVAGILPFDATDAPVDLVVVVQTSQRFADALNELAEPLAKLVSHLPKATTRVAVITYGGEDAMHASQLGDPARAGRVIDSILPEDYDDPPQLLKALDRGIKVLKSAPPTASGRVPRRLMFVISDGINEVYTGDGIPDEATRQDFNARVKAAAAENITIHTLAYSVNDRRWPYYNLSQLSRKTAGTFRYAIDRSSLAPLLDAVERELRGQLVLTYFLPEALVVGEKLRVLCTSTVCGAQLPLASNERKAPAEPSCAGKTCGLGEVCVGSTTCVLAPITASGSHLGRYLALGALVVVGAGAGTMVMRRRKTRKEAAAAAQAPPPQAPPQIVMPDFSNMPYLAGSAQVQQMQQLAQLAARGGQMGQMGAVAHQAPAQQAAPVLPPGRAGTLFILSGPRRGQTLPLRHGFTIGKTPGCDLLVEDAYASGYHAQFHLDATGACTVVDMNTTNGTFVNGVRVSRQQLSHGMTIRVGQTEVRYLQGS